MNHLNISELQLYNKLTESLQTHKRVQIPTPEALENDYMIEYFRRKLRKSRSYKALQNSKQNSLSPLRSSIDFKRPNVKNEEISSLKPTPDNKETKSFRNDKSPLKAKVLSRLISSRRLDITKANTSSSTPHFKKSPEIRKVKLIPKNKFKARLDYYDNNVRRHHFPTTKESNNLEVKLRSFSSERLKTFKDFRVVKLFK
jgi:hypothetical protein